MVKLFARVQVAKMQIASRIATWAHRENGNEFVTYGALTAFVILVALFVYALVTGKLMPFISDQFSSLGDI